MSQYTVLLVRCRIPAFKGLASLSDAAGWTWQASASDEMGGMQAHGETAGAAYTRLERKLPERAKVTKLFVNVDGKVLAFVPIRGAWPDELANWLKNILSEEVPPYSEGILIV